MKKYRVVDAWRAPEPYSFTGDNGSKVTLQTHVLTLEGGEKISVSKKPEFAGFEVGKEYDFEIGAPSTSGKTKKAKHLTQLTKCPECGHEFSPSFASKPRTASPSDLNPKQVPDSPPENNAPQNGSPVPDESQAPSGLDRLEF